MFRKLIAILLSVIFLAGCGNGTTEENSASEGTVKSQGRILNLCAFTPDTLNPLATALRTNMDLLYLVYEGLFCVEEDFSATPVIAKGLHYEGGVWATVFLKQGIKFHDGSACTAEDVVYSFQQAKKYQPFFSATLSNIVDCRAAGEYEVAFTLAYPQPNVANLLTFPVVPSTLTEPDFSSNNAAFVPVGTGPYCYESSMAYRNITLMRNPQWHGDNRPNIERIRVSYIKERDLGVYAFDAGEMDMITTDIYDWGGQPFARDIRLVETTDNHLTFLGINHGNLLLSDPMIRNTINQMIDKKELVTDYLYSHATAADVPVNPKAYFSSVEYQEITPDLELIHKLLVESGWMDLNGDGILDRQIEENEYSLSFSLLVSTGQPVRRAVAEEISAVAGRIGMKIAVEMVDYSTYLARIEARDYDLFLGEMELTSDCNPRNLLHSAGEKNYFGYYDGQMDELLNRLAVEDVSSVYENFEAKFMTDMPFVCLYYESHALLCAPSIKGEISHPRTAPYNGLVGAYVE